ncbi:MAG TPA: zinc-ribbon domain-containing protein [Myxococcota bacterium]
MRHSCEHCQTNYEIADDKVAGRFVKVRCQRCKGTMHVVGVTKNGAPVERFWCAFSGQVKGPYGREEIELFINLGDISARTRMWKPGMPNWERVCESSTLGWVYAAVVDRVADDAHITTGEKTDVFANAALLTDGAGWFPDPTLKSGVFILDEETQSQLQRLHETGVFDAPAAEAPKKKLGGAVLAAVAGATMAVGGFVWLVVENMI